MITLSQLWSAGALGRSRSPAIGAATTARELHAIGRLRYRLFVERDGEVSVHADGADGLLLEPIDAASLNLWASSDPGCLAAVRVTHGADAMSDPRLAAMLRHSALPQAAYPSCLVFSRMVVRQKARAQALAPALARHAYRVGLGTGAATALLATRPEHAGWFERLGFTPSGASWTDAGAGELRCLVLRMLDRASLEAVGSPLLAELNAFEAEGPAAATQVSVLELTDDL